MDIRETDSPKIQSNIEARYRRHNRVFLRSIFISKTLFRLLLDLKALFFRSRFPRHVAINSTLVFKDPFSKFLRQSVAVAVALLVVTSIAPQGILETGFTADYIEEDTDFLGENIEEELPPFIMNEEGFILKTSPASAEVSRIGLTDAVAHTVVEGESLSAIAAMYSVSVKTLVWENNITETSTLRVGQTLVIPSVDGVSHLVNSDKETLSKIAKEYSVNESLIKEHNKLDGDTILKGQKLFIPGGKKKMPLIAVRSGSRNSARKPSRNTFSAKIVMSTDEEPEEGKQLIFPTSGRVTQGFRRGHYAVDIANTSKPDVWAAGAGIVVKSDGGCPSREEKVDKRCNGGYGNYVAIDHGEGLQTLYAHCETLYVNEGQSIEAGQALCTMGNSGRVYGRSGIHVHWECILNGVKKNCAKFY